MIVVMRIARWSITQTGVLTIYLEGSTSIEASFTCRKSSAAHEPVWAAAGVATNKDNRLGASAEEEQCKRELDQLVLSHPHLSRICDDLWGITSPLYNEEVSEEDAKQANDG